MQVAEVQYAVAFQCPREPFEFQRNVPDYRAQGIGDAAPVLAGDLQSGF